MTPADAFKAVKRLLGPKAYLVTNENAPRDEETRAANQEKYREMKAVVEDARGRMERRREAVLAADAEYQAELAAWLKAKADRATLSTGLNYRYSAGTVDTIGGMKIRNPIAYGCNLQALVDDIKAKQAAKAEKAAS